MISRNLKKAKENIVNNDPHAKMNDTSIYVIIYN